MEPLSSPSSLSSFPGITLEASGGTAPAAAEPMPLPAQPFTLWLSPDAWPKPALQLPGGAFTLWLDPDKWPKPRLRLPGNGFALWLCPDSWPRPKLRLPSLCTTVWLDESRWPAVPHPEAAVSAEPALLKLPGLATTLWLSESRWPVASPAPDPEPATPSPEPVAMAEESPPAVPVAEVPPEEPPPLISIPDVPPPMSTPIQIPANRSFTLWTASELPADPAKEAPVAAKSKMRLPGQPFTLWTQPGRVDRLIMRNAAPASTAEIFPPRPAAGSKMRWLPAAAAIALAALAGTSYLNEKKQREKFEGDYTALQKKASSDLDAAKSRLTEASTAAAKASSELTAKQADFTGEIAKLKTSLTAAEEAGKKSDVRGTETAAALDKANKALADAKKEFTAKETTLQTNLTNLTEEAGKARRTAGEELNKAKEAVAKLEVDKAAAVKEAAGVAADRDLLKAEVEKLRKQLQSPQKPSGVPDGQQPL